MDYSIEKNLEQWCEDNGWTDLFAQKGQLYAFPPSAVMPLPVPTVAVESAKKNQESKNRILQQLLLAITPILAVMLLTYFGNFPLWLSLTKVISLSIFVRFVRYLWNWFGFIKLWTNSR